MRIIILNSNNSYVDFYNKISRCFKSSPKRYKLFLFVYQYLVWATIIIYAALLLYCLITADYQKMIKAVLTPAFTFAAVTILRRLINAPRPYTVYPIEPLIVKEKKGESFPSRHTLSITIIAMVGLYVWWPAGVLLWIMAICMGISRVIAGVHFPRDVVAAALISIVVGIGMFL